MKKIMLCFSLLCTLFFSTISVCAMDSETLLSNPARYRVISSEPDGIVYVDMETISGMQTMDYPNSIENITCVLYAEKYNSTIDAMTFANDQTIRQINEYQASFYANKREDTYELETTLTNICTPKGDPWAVKPDTLQWGSTKKMFIVLSRLAKHA